MKAFPTSKILKDYNIPLLLFSLVYYAIIIYLSKTLNVWEDEIYSLDTSSDSLKYAFHQSLYFETQPPVYFVLLTIWRSISGSILWARLFSFVLIVLSQIVLYKFLKNSINRKIAAIVTILFLLNPWTIFSVLEIRLYALIIFLSLLIVVTFYGTYYNNVKPAGRIIYILLAIAGVFTQYFIGFLLVANAAVLLIEGKKRLFRLYMLDMMIPLILILLYIPLVRLSVGVQTSIVPEYSRTFWGFLGEAKGFFTQMSFDYLLPSNLFYSGYLIWVLRGVMVIIIFTGLFQTGILKGLRSISSFLIINLVIMFFFIIVLYIFGKYSTDFKYAFVLFGPIYLTLAFLLKLFKPHIIYIFLIFIISFYIIWDYSRYKGLYKVKDYKALCANVKKNEREGEPLLIYRNISAEIIKIYYSGINEVVALPHEFVYDRGYGTYLWEIEENDLIELNNKLEGIDDFHLVIDNSPLAGFNEEKKKLIEFLTVNFSVTKEEPYKGQLYLYKFSRKPGQYDKTN